MRRKLTSARASQILIDRGLLPEVNAYTEKHFLNRAKDGDRDAVRAYLALGMPAHVRDADNRGTPLIRAAEGNHPEIIRLLVESGAELEARDRDDDTALLTAVNWKNPEALHTLIEVGADINAVSHTSGTPLISAIRKKNLEIFQIVRQASADVNVRYGSGRYTPLYYAIVTGAPDAAYYAVPLILTGADIDARVGPHNRPLLSYAILNEQEEIFKALVAAGANLNAVDDLGWTPWHLAHYRGWTPRGVLQLLGWDWPADATEPARPDWKSEVLTAAHTFAMNWRKYLSAAGVEMEFLPEHDLLKAAQSGDVEPLQAALDAGADLEARDPDGDTALALACYKGQVTTVHLLLQAGAATVPPTPGNWSPLMFAVNAESLSCVEVLLEAGAAPAHGPDWSPLSKAAQKGNLDMVKALIAAGADLHAGDTRGQTALHWAAGKGRLEMLDILIDAGAALDSQAHSGSTALKVAVGNRQQQAASRLLNAGADPDIRDNLGETPLFSASFKGDAEMVTLLLRAGADPAIPNHLGSFPLTIARSMKKEACVKLLVAALTQDPFMQAINVLNLKERADPAVLPPAFYAQLAERSCPLSLVEWARQGESAVAAGLLRAGAAPDARNGYGETALMIAARAGDLETVRVLLDAGADVAARSNIGSTALHKAASGGHVSVIRALLAAGADPNQGDKWRHTSMHAAAEGGFPEALVALHDAGGAVDPDPAGNTPLMRAARFDRTAALLWLIEAGAALDTRNARLETALSLTVRKRNYVNAGHLLNAGADPNLAGEGGRTPLIDAAVAGELEIVYLLLRAGADPALPDAQGRTALELASHREEIAAALSAALDVEVPALPLRPVDLPPKPALHRAAQRGDLRDVRRLLAEGAEVDARNARGDTALMLAAERGHTPVVRALLEAGADVQAENRVGENAWVLAATLKQEEAEAALKAAGAEVDVDRMLVHMDRLETLQAALRKGAITEVHELIERGAVDIDGLDAGRQSPLIMAVYKGDLMLTRLLLAAGADPELPNLAGYTPLMVAARGNHLALTRLLLETGVPVDAAAPSGATALLLASGEGDAETVACLLDAGAEPSRADRRGITPLMQAVAAGSEVVVEQLVEAGADLHACDGAGVSATDWAVLTEHPALAERLQRMGGPPPQPGTQPQE